MRIFKLVCCLCVIACMSCTHDTYDQGDGKYSYLKAEMVLAHLGSDGYMDYAVNDKQDTIKPTLPYPTGWKIKQEGLYRGMLYYNATPHTAPEVIILQPVKVLELLETAVEDSIQQTSPVNVESIWASDINKKKCINMSLKVYTGEIDGVQTKHTFAVHLDSVVTQKDGKRKAFASLYHQKDREIRAYRQKVYLSVLLSLKEPVDSVNMKVPVDGDMLTYRIAVK